MPDLPVPAAAPAARTGILPPARRSRWVRNLPWAGVALLSVQVTALVAVWSSRPDKVLPVLSTVPVLFTGGKEAAIPFGIAVGAPAGLVAFTMIVVDVAANFILYPLVHLMMDSLEDPQGALGRRMPFVGRMLRGAVRRAAKRRHIVDRYGVAGLYAFAIIPFAFNGPPIVAAMGRLAGLRAHQVVPVFVAAIVTTTAAWCVFYSLGFSFLDRVNKLIPLALALTIMVVMLAVGAIGAMREKREETRLV